MSDLERRTVEVRGAKGASITLDREALRFDFPNRAPSWMPLARLGELRLGGPIGLGAGVIEALLARRVRVCWTTRTGGAVAELWPLRARQPTLAARLDELLRQPDWHRGYQLWRLTLMMWTTQRALGRRPQRREIVLWEHPTRLARTLLPERTDLHAVLDRIGEYCAADARRLLLNRGWPIDWLRAPRPGPRLARDIAIAMVWEAMIVLAKTPPKPDERAIDWYARHRLRIVLHGMLAHTSFSRWLQDRTGGPGTE